MRKEDPRGDFGRQMRQRQVMQAVIKKGASFFIKLWRCTYSDSKECEDKLNTRSNV